MVDINLYMGYNYITNNFCFQYLVMIVYILLVQTILILLTIIQEFMDMESDERNKVFAEYKIQKELNIKIKPVLNTIYDCLFKSV